MAYEHIQTIDLTTSVGSIDITNLPQNYDQIVVHATVGGSGTISVRLDGQTGSSYYPSHTATFSNSFSFYNQININRIPFNEVRNANGTAGGFILTLTGNLATNRYNSVFFMGTSTSDTTLYWGRGNFRNSITDTVDAITLVGGTFDSRTIINVYGVI